MTKDEILSRVGRDAYREACKELYTAASHPEFGAVLQGGLPVTSDLPHEICDLIWEGPAPWRTKISLFFEIYDEMPAYGHLLYAKHYYKSFASSDCAYWWHQVIERLKASKPALRQPLEYALWCDFFEDPETVEEAWSHLACRGNPPEVLRSVLEASGPVPYSLKQQLYLDLVAQERWHPSIFRSLLGSAFDVYGDIDPEAAARILARLHLQESAELTRLRERLQA